MVDSVPFTAAALAAHDDQRALGPDGDRALVELLAEVFAGGTVLDVGGGTGWASRALAAGGARPVLVDLSAPALALAPGLTRVRGDLALLPLADACVDGVHAAYALQNVADWRRAVAECARVVRPGGLLLVAWGGRPPDPLVGNVSRQVAYEIRRAGGHVGTVAEQAGLAGVSDGDAALAAVGCRYEGEDVVRGARRRTLRQLVERTAANPFRWRATPAQRGAAADHALAWVSRELGDVDEVRSVAAEHRYRRYRREALTT